MTSHQLDERRITILETKNAALRAALAKAYAIMEHLGERLNEADLAFDDEHLETITNDWELVRAALAQPASAENLGDPTAPGESQ